MSSELPHTTDDEDIMTKVEAGEGLRRPNRKERRRKVKNRGFTKKGNTRVIRRDANGKLWNIPTPVGSRIHNMAKANVKKMHRKKEMPYESKDGAGR